jgi:hypothetical protein
MGAWMRNPNFITCVDVLLRAVFNFGPAVRILLNHDAALSFYGGRAGGSSPHPGGCRRW